MDYWRLIRNEIRNYKDLFFRGIPSDVFEWTLPVIILALIFILWKEGKVTRIVYSYLLIVYLTFLLLSTVVFRIASRDRRYDYIPFHSYDRPELLVENIMNIIVFIPVGFLLGCGLGKMRWWKVLLIGLVISLSIEMLQFILKRGFSEVDDIIHNTFGCMIGFGVYNFVRFGYGKFTKRRMAVL